MICILAAQWVAKLREKFQIFYNFCTFLPLQLQLNYNEKKYIFLHALQTAKRFLVCCLVNNMMTKSPAVAVTLVQKTFVLKQIVQKDYIFEILYIIVRKLIPVQMTKFPRVKELAKAQNLHYKLQIYIQYFEIDIIHLQ